MLTLARRSSEKGESMNRDSVGRKPIAVSQFFAKEMKLSLLWMPFTTAVLLWVLCPSLLKAQEEPFLPGPVRVVSTVPANGDLNPYGVAFVPSVFPAGET